MAKVLITEQYLTDIADAIRVKAETTDTFFPSEMASAIMGIDTTGFIPTGTIPITSNGTYDVTNYASAEVNVPTGPSVNNQNKSVNPTESQQSITADSGYTGLGTVTVGAISSTYVGSGIDRRDNDDLAVSGAIVNVPAGYYSVTASKSVASGSATGPSSLSGSSASITTGTNTITLTKTGVTITPTVSAGYVSNATASTATVALTASVTVDPTPTASGATVTIPAGYYSADATKSVMTMTLPTSTSASATSGYTSKATISRSTSDQYINIPPGYNSAGGYYKISAVANGSTTGPSTVSSTGASVSTSGTNTLTLTKTGVSTTPTVSAGYVSSATSSTATVTLSASVNIRSSSDLSSNTLTVTAPAGYYASAATKTLSDANLIAGNIKKDVIIFGTTGTYEGSGGGATNIVQGTFTTGATRGGTGTVTLNYNGNGYPIEVTVYIAGGPYNNTSQGNTDWYNNKQRYDVAMYNMIKSEITSAPTYSTKGTNNSGFTAVTYKGSTTTATSYSRTGATSTNFYTSSSTNASAGSTSIRMKGNGKTMAYYVGTSTNNTIGLAPSTEYEYIVVYSS